MTINEPNKKKITITWEKTFFFSKKLKLMQLNYHIIKHGRTKLGIKRIKKPELTW